jgi:hypothetical protein
MTRAQELWAVVRKSVMIIAKINVLERNSRINIHGDVS